MAITKGLIIAVLIHTLLSGSVKYVGSSMNLMQPFIMNFLNSSFDDHYGLNLTSNGFSWLWSIMATIDNISSFCTTLFYVWLLDTFGRKYCFMIINNCVLITACVLQTISKPLNSFECYTLGRILTGASEALSDAPGTLFVAECSPDECRGKMSQFVSAGRMGWLVLATILALPLGTEDLWPYFYLIPIPFALMHILSSFFIPRSPKFLYLKRHDVSEARKSLRFYHGLNYDEEGTFARFNQEASQADHGMSLGEILQQHHLFKPLLVTLVANMSLALGGFELTAEYGVPILRWVGLSQSAATILTFVRAIATSFGVVIVSMFLIEKVSRRGLFLLSLCLHIGELICFAVICWNKTGYTFGLDLEPSKLSALHVTLVLLACFFQTIKDTIVPFFLATLLVAEICPQGTRAKVMQIVLTARYIATACVTISFPPLVNAIGAWAFVIFILISVSCLLWLWLNLPDTRQRAVNEVVAQYQQQQDQEAPLMQEIF